MKNNISYYTHAAGADTHWKFVALRRKFGWQGEGKFWALNNRISMSEYCKLNLNDEELIEATAAALDFDPEEFIEYVEYLKKVRLVIDEDGFITTEIVQECLEEVMGRREYQRERAKGGSKKSIVENEKPIVENSKSTIENAKSIVENEQSKVKKSKEEYKEIKKEINKERKKEKNEPFEEFWKIYDRQNNKPKALYQWEKLTEDEQAIAIEHAGRFAACTEQRYRPHPERYLRDKRFNDDIIINKKTNNGLNNTFSNTYEDFERL